MTATQAHILVVDDDDRLRSLLKRYLSEQGYAVSVAENTTKAKEILSLLTPDLMVLDGMMPGQTGLEFAHELGADRLTPILMLTALDRASDRVAGLESGVDDYLTKPFEPRELVIRISNILKRKTVTPEKQALLYFADFSFNPQMQQLSRISTQEIIALTTAERETLSLLCHSPNQPLTREYLARALEGNDTLRHVDVQVGRLRKKLDDGSAIQTVRGKGYKLVVSRIT